MITYKNCTGYGNSNGMIVYLSAWSTEGSTPGGMRFFPGPVEMIVDAQITSENTLLIYVYPHNNKEEVGKLAEKLEKQIVEEILSAKVKVNTSREIWTIQLLENGVHALTQNDFCDYFPSSEVKDTLLIFETIAESVKFPKIFVFSKEQRGGSTKYIVNVFAKSSHGIMPAISSQSLIGKEVVYSLLRAESTGKLDTDRPSLGGIRFPTKAVAGVSEDLHTKELIRFAEGLQETMSISKTGVLTIIPDKKPVTSLVKLNSEEDKLEMSIINQIVYTDSINLTDVFEYGLGETMRLIPADKPLIKININIGGIAKRMCIYEGKVYIDPVERNFSAEECFAESDSMFIVTENMPEISTVKKGN